ncbi:MAG: hypothetical protein GKR98_05885 [Boseongicola sp.]|nr:MAG: hypothetical protein GKR98_05885 [Boseongicola sp.]
MNSLDWVYLSIAVGLILVGGWMLAVSLMHHRRSVTVEIDVIDLIEGRSGYEADSPTFAPVFRVVGGPHQGKEWQSRIVASSAAHEVGDRLSGSFDPKTGAIHSGRTSGWQWFLGVVYALAGFGLLVWVS